jgi:hypothetical protein
MQQELSNQEYHELIQFSREMNCITTKNIKVVQHFATEYDIKSGLAFEEEIAN